MNAIKTIINFSSNNGQMKGVIGEFFTNKEPSRKYIKEKIEEILSSKLEIRDYSPENGGDFGAFFFFNNAYITYTFKEITIDNV